MRWEEMSWDKVRRAQMRWKCGVWRVQCEVWSVKCEVWSVECEVWSVECAVGSVQWSVKCGLGRVQCEVRSVECEVWSVQCGVWRVQWEVWRAKWSFKCDMGNRTPLSQSARTHALGWRTAHASSIDEKGLIYIFKATSAPPRAGTTGIIIYMYTLMPYIHTGYHPHEKYRLCVMKSTMVSYPMFVPLYPTMLLAVSTPIFWAWVWLTYFREFPTSETSGYHTAMAGDSSPQSYKVTIIYADKWKINVLNR